MISNNMSQEATFSVVDFLGFSGFFAFFFCRNSFFFIQNKLTVALLLLLVLREDDQESHKDVDEVKEKLQGVSNKVFVSLD